jgi:hypothetical protein
MCGVQCGGDVMEVTVLAVPDCPNAPLLEQRLADAVMGRPGVTVRRVEIAETATAAQYGMSGSPTLLVNGRDPFTRAGAGPALACRLYHDDDGRLAGVPSVAALRWALAQGGASTSGPERGSCGIDVPCVDLPVDEAFGESNPQG